MQKHGGGKSEGGIEGGDDEGSQGVEGGCRSDVDQCEENTDDGGQTDAV